MSTLEDRELANRSTEWIPVTIRDLRAQLAEANARAERLEGLLRRAAACKYCRGAGKIRSLVTHGIGAWAEDKRIGPEEDCNVCYGSGIGDQDARAALASGGKP